MIVSLLEHYWEKTMADAERKVILRDWVTALDGAPLGAVYKARLAWLVDIKRGHRAPKISEFIALIDWPGRKRATGGTIGPAPAELSPPHWSPWDKRTPAEKWSSYARLHAFFDATGRTNPRPVDPDMNYYDIDLVKQALAEAQIRGTARAWVKMMVTAPEAPTGTALTRSDTADNGGEG